VAEWSKAAVLKTVEGQPSQGSNPCLSAILWLLTGGIIQIPGVSPFPAAVASSNRQACPGLPWTLLFIDTLSLRLVPVTPVVNIHEGLIDRHVLYGMGVLFLPTDDNIPGKKTE
jgi:hypothetical protein